MPQLDKVTFLSQYFWLCFFYLGFYYILLKFYLPKISRILALRLKKKGSSQEGLISLQGEKKNIGENYELLVSQILVTSKTLFHGFFSHTRNWLNLHAATINKTQYQQANMSYVHSLGETLLSEKSFFYHASKNLPEKGTFRVYLKTCNNLSSSRFGILPSVTKATPSTQEMKKKIKK